MKKTGIEILILSVADLIAAIYINETIFIIAGIIGILCGVAFYFSKEKEKKETTDK